MELRKITDLACQNKTVFVRHDPLSLDLDGSAGDLPQASYDSLRFLLEKGCKVVVGAHYGASGLNSQEKISLEPYGYLLSRVFGREVIFIEDYHKMPIENVIKQSGSHQIILLENLAFCQGELNNQPEFLDNISGGIDFYVNDSFASVDQTHASVIGFSAKLPSISMGAGFELAREFEILRKMKFNPISPFTALINGNDVETAAPLILNLCNNCTYILLTGELALAFALIHAGYSGVKGCLSPTVEQVVHEITSSAASWRVQLVIPKDFKGIIDGRDVSFNISEVEKIGCKFDSISPGAITLAEYARVLELSKTIFYTTTNAIRENTSDLLGDGIGPWLVPVLASLNANIVVNDVNLARFCQGEVQGLNPKCFSFGCRTTNKYFEGKALPGLDVIMQ